jgi:hypothetical protein
MFYFIMPSFLCSNRFSDPLIPLILFFRAFPFRHDIRVRFIKTIPALRGVPRVIMFSTGFTEFHTVMNSKMAFLAVCYTLREVKI